MQIIINANKYIPEPINDILKYGNWKMNTSETEKINNFLLKNALKNFFKFNVLLRKIFTIMTNLL